MKNYICSTLTQHQELFKQLTKDMTRTVFLTGATGFIAQNIVKTLIENDYNVVGTVRTEAKGDHLTKLLNSEKFKYEIVPDISVEGAFDEALSKHPEATVLLHTASPFFYDTTDPENDLVLPAIRGTKNIMKAVTKFGKNIERFVITSSDAAIYSAEDEQDATKSFDELSWNNITYEESLTDGVTAYYGAKSFAEKAAWEYIEKNPGFPALTAVNPVYVFGPQAFDSEVKDVLNVSNELINSLIKLGPNDKFEIDKGGFVDVRDVAKAHVLAFEKEETIGKRLFLTNGQFSSQMMIDIINENFPELKGKIPVGEPGTGPEHIKSLGRVDNSKTKQLLGFEFSSLDKIVVDTIKQVLAKKSK